MHSTLARYAVLAAALLLGSLQLGTSAAAAQTETFTDSYRVRNCFDSAGVDYCYEEQGVVHCTIQADGDTNCFNNYRACSSETVIATGEELSEFCSKAQRRFRLRDGEATFRDHTKSQYTSGGMTCRYHYIVIFTFDPFSVEVQKSQFNCT